MATTRSVRFAPGTLVSPGEYRNTDTGVTRFFDGNTPLPGTTNSGSWQQVSDHHHPDLRGARDADAAAGEPAAVPAGPHGVRFAAGTVPMAGEYRNTDTGATRWFDGSTPLPGGPNSGSWQQVSDHFHAGDQPTEARRSDPGSATHGVRFASGTVVSPGLYRNTETGATHFFDGRTALPGGPNAGSWQQVSDHYHAR